MHHQKKTDLLADPSAPDQVHRKPLIWQVLPNIIAFGLGLGLAWFLKWETTDLVWSLWLCSLVVGYLTILSVIFGGAYFGYHVIKHEDFKKKHLIPAIFFGLIGGLFFLGFFSLHFGGFHAGHSVFLQQFFPVEGMPKDGFGAAFMNPPLLWKLVFKHLIGPYGLFLIPALIAERRHVFKTLIDAVWAVRQGVAPDDLKGGVAKKLQKKGRGTKRSNDFMARPYLNVIRMHFLIFFFAFSHFIKIDSFLVYAAVYFVYFFPWSDIRSLKKLNSKKV